jgi:starch-binding outer membrane protein, SusD/RagB family
MIKYFYQHKTPKQLQAISLLLLMLVLTSSCTKDFLDKKPDKSQVVPTTIADFDAMLNNSDVMNNMYPSIHIVTGDELFVPDDLYGSITDVTAKNAYVWSRELFNENEMNDWSFPYVIVFNSNVILEQLDKAVIDDYSVTDKDRIKGSALFLRGTAFYSVAQLFAKPYDAASASTDAGIPLRLASDLNENSTRSSVKETYDRIISDLTKAAWLLPAQANYKSQPIKAAAYGMLARTFLSMRLYEKAGLYADSSLQLQNDLMDFNELDLSATSPIPLYNNEVIFHINLPGKQAFSRSRGRIDSTLYKSYEPNDLRKVTFFNVLDSNIVNFRGSYTGTSTLFGGLATDEMYLIRAESNARKGNVDEALNDLNSLLEKRFIAGTFVPLTAGTPEEALELVLTERKKELLFRGLRWTDLRRLNKEDRFSTTIRRVVNGQEYLLLPNDSRYVFPIPAGVIKNTGMSQNP